jgi:hypothetical protein
MVRRLFALRLLRRRQARIDRAILAYAMAVAGTVDDLDPDLEVAGLELFEPGVAVLNRVQLDLSLNRRVQVQSP